MTIPNPQPPGDRRQATLIGVAAILLWACLAPLTVAAGGLPPFELPPFELLALSFAVATISGLVLLAVRGRAALARLKQPLAPWLTAFIGIFGYHALYFYALSAAPAAEASLIAYLWPLLIVLLSAIGPGRHLARRHLIGALLGLGGTALIVLGRTGGTAGPALVAGYSAALGCALLWSGYSVINRRFGTVPCEMIVGVCGAVALAGFACHLALETTVVPANGQILALIALGLGPTGLAFLAWDHATKHGHLPLLGALSYLAPLLSTLLLVATGVATATGRLALAAVLIVAGSVLATKG